MRDENEGYLSIKRENDEMINSRHYMRRAIESSWIVETWNKMNRKINASYEFLFVLITIRRTEVLYSRDNSAKQVLVLWLDPTMSLKLITAPIRLGTWAQILTSASNELGTLCEIIFYRLAHPAAIRDIIKSCLHLLMSRSPWQSPLRHFPLPLHFRLCRCRLGDILANRNPNCRLHPSSMVAGRIV